jgi:hypothetical protein
MGGAASIAGGCNCGQIRYQLSAAPLTCYLCHCHLCQKRTGSPFSMTLVLPAGALEITEGQTQSTQRVRPDGAVNVGHICGVCQSRIHTEVVGRPTVNLRAGALDDTSWVRPVAQFWATSAQPWALVPDILTYDQQPTDPTPMLAA